MIDKETAIVMCYTGWTREMATAAIIRWRIVEPDWSTEHMKRYLSAHAQEKLKRLTGEMNDEPAERKNMEERNHPAIEALDRLQAELERAKARCRVRAECLETAMKTLYWYGHNCPVLLCPEASEALDDIERRLAELEPGEKTEPAPDALPCGHPRSAARGDGLTHWCAMCEEEARGE